MKKDEKLQEQKPKKQKSENQYWIDREKQSQKLRGGFSNPFMESF